MLIYVFLAACVVSLVMTYMKVNQNRVDVGLMLLTIVSWLGFLLVTLTSYYLHWWPFDY